MPQIVLFGGVLLLVYGVAALAGGRMASPDRGSPPSRLTGVLTGAAGVALIITGLSLLLAG